jgi:hypothetical protein
LSLVVLVADIKHLVIFDVTDEFPVKATATSVMFDVADEIEISTSSNPLFSPIVRTVVLADTFALIVAFFPPEYRVTFAGRMRLFSL